MPLLARDQAFQATAPFHDIWLEAHRTAWSRWTKLVKDEPEFTAPLNSSARFNILNCHIVNEVEKAVPNTVRVSGGPGLLIQVIEDAAIVRFKHLNGSGLFPRYNATFRQDALMEQAFTEEFMDQLEIVEPLTSLICGFTLTPGEDEISQVVVACHNPTLQYYFPLDSGAGAEMLTLPGVEPTGPRVSSRIVTETDRSFDNEPS